MKDFSAGIKRINDPFNHDPPDQRDALYRRKRRMLVWQRRLYELLIFMTGTLVGLMITHYLSPT